ncbi:hypothetical protein D3C86_1530040 [compost metagenome]
MLLDVIEDQRASTGNRVEHLLFVQRVVLVIRVAVHIVDEVVFVDGVVMVGDTHFRVQQCVVVKNLIEGLHVEQTREFFCGAFDVQGSVIKVVGQKLLLADVFEHETEDGHGAGL